MSEKSGASKKVRRRSAARWTGVYLLMSKDAREMALVTLSDAPQRVADFVESIEQWLNVMRKQADAVDQLDEETNGEGIQ